MNILGILLKALDLLLSIDAFAIAGLFSVALVMEWDLAHPRVRRFLWGDILIFVVMGLWAGNIAWMFYLEDADPWHSLAHPVVRFIYLIGGMTGFKVHAANVLSDLRHWPCTLMFLVLIDLAVLTGLVVGEVLA